MRIGVDEELDETGGKTIDEIQEEIDAKEAQARAHVLEMVHMHIIDWFLLIFGINWIFNV